MPTPDLHAHVSEGWKKLGSDVKRILSPRDRCKRRHSEPSEAERTEIRPRHRRTNTEHHQPPRCAEGQQPVGILQNSPRTDSWRPIRAVTFRAISAEPEELNTGEEEAQPSDPSSNKPSRRSTRSSTWSSRASIRSAASAASAVAKRVFCIEPSALGPRRLLRSKSDQLWRRKQRDERCSDEKTKQRHNTFPVLTPIMVENTKPDLGPLREFLRRREETSKDFSNIWETKALPKLRDTMFENSVSDYSITVQFDYEASQRIVEVMTKKALPEDVGSKVNNDVSMLFMQARFTSPVDVQFIVGEVRRSSSTSPVDGPFDAASNPLMHPLPLLQGDSVGCHEGPGSAATIGPAIKCGREVCCLVNYHLFEDVNDLNKLTNEYKPSPLHLVHPAQSDCTGNQRPRQIAKLIACSGKMCSTHRKSRSLQRFAEVSADDALVVTDWAVCRFLDDTAVQLQNRLRYAPVGREFQEVSGPMPGVFQERPSLRIVRSSGRSSGIRWAVVGEVPALVMHGSGPATLEWYLECIPPNIPGGMPIREWNSGGPGVPGDSGAAVINDDDKGLIGQIWGRNVYGGNARTPRIAYFTHAFDIFDDIEEHYPDLGYPTLIVEPTDEPESRPPVPLIVTPQQSVRAPFPYQEDDGTTLGSQRSSWKPALSPTDEKGETNSISHGSMTASACGSSAYNEPVATSITLFEKEVGAGVSIQQRSPIIG